jgi:Kef-type K+ transport system membrane component KefB
VQILLAYLLQASTSLDQARPVIGLVAGALAAMIAAYGGWHLTDWLIAWRQRLEED